MRKRVIVAKQMNETSPIVMDIYPSIAEAKRKGLAVSKINTLADKGTISVIETCGNKSYNFYTKVYDLKFQEWNPYSITIKIYNKPTLIIAESPIEVTDITEKYKEF